MTAPIVVTGAKMLLRHKMTKFLAEKSRDVYGRFAMRRGAEQTPCTLSGGNVQKLILARELERDPSILIAAQPTRGVDIGASEYIHKRLLGQREKGTATLLISEDLDEIRALSDRIAVIFEGRLMGIVDVAPH